MLEQNGLTGIAEKPFPNDGWSGATLTVLERGRDRFVLKRTSPAIDWIVRATHDIALREGVIAGGQLLLVEPLVAPYLGTAADGEGVAILMPDLSAELIAWERPSHDPLVSEVTLDRVIDAVARFHAMPWANYRPTTRDWDWPWCPLRERLLLLTRSAAERYRAEGLAVGERFLAGWDAFDRAAPASARGLVERLSADPSPLLDALARLPSTGLHGDLKLANVAILDDGRVALIDWQMMTLAPVAVELGWMLVANSASLPIGPEELLTSYRLAAGRAALDSMRLAGSWHTGGDRSRPETERLADRFGTLPPRGLDATIGDWEAQVDLVWIVGLLLRGWRKGLDAEGGVVLASGVRAADDLAWWSERALEAAERRL
jgi:phosphotransferase family enzyme